MSVLAALATMWFIVCVVVRASIRSVRQREWFFTSLSIEWAKAERKIEEELRELEKTKRRKPPT